jgi:hypothetical protein
MPTNEEWAESEAAWDKFFEDHGDELAKRRDDAIDQFRAGLCEPMDDMFQTPKEPLMLQYTKLLDLARDYANLEESSLSELIGTVCHAIYKYDGGFGDMPNKETDLHNAAMWLTNLVVNDLKYHIANNEGDISIDKRKWLETHKREIDEMINEQ